MERPPAQGKYHEALAAAPRKAAQQRAMYAANKAAVQMRRDNWKEAIQDCSEALEQDAGYVKALLRRAAAYEQIDDLEHCLADYEKVGAQHIHAPRAPKCAARSRRLS